MFGDLRHWLSDVNNDYLMLFGFLLICLLVAVFSIGYRFSENQHEGSVEILKAANLYGDKNLNDTANKIIACFQLYSVEENRLINCSGYQKEMIDRINFLEKKAVPTEKLHNFISGNTAMPYSENYYEIMEERQNGEYILRFTKNSECLKLEAVGNTGSMRPTIKDDSSILVDGCFPKEKLLVNDTISFFTPETYRIAHRIIFIDQNNQSIQTKGDNNLNPDRGITFEDYREKVIGVFDDRQPSGGEN